MTERVVLSFGAGAACLSTVVFVLCSLGLASTPGLMLATAVCVAVSAVGLRPGCRPSLQTRLAGLETRRRPGGLPHFAAMLFWIIAAPFAAVYIVNAAAPEISPDGSYYHLGLVRRYLNHGGFYRITTDMFANLSQGCEMLFLAAYALGRHSAAALTHCAFLLALPAALVAYGRRFGLETEGIIAALLVFVSPVVGIDGLSAYVDVALGFAGFACFYALELWHEESQARYLVLAGLMAGFCFAIKFTGAAAGIFAMVYVLWRARSLRSLALLLAPAAIVALPWLVKNWMMVDNPFSPFFNRVFPNPYIHISFEDDLRQAMRHMNGFQFGFQTPLELTVRGGLLQGTLGPAFLLAPVGLLAMRDPRGRLALAAAALLGLPWFANVGTRFLIPSLPCLALSMGIALSKWPRAAAVLVILNAIACWPWVLGLYCTPFSWRITRFPIAAALRITPEQQFLDTYAPEVRFARLLQDKMPPNGAVYTAQPVMTSYTDRTIVLNYAAALNERIADTLASAVIPAMQPSERVSFSFVEREVRGVRLVATGESRMWTIAEIEAGVSATRAPANPWDASLAADRQLATAWRSWQPVRPGMQIEFDLAPAKTIGSVAFRTRPADPPPPMRLELRDAGGTWRTAGVEAKRESGIPVPDVRGQATAELRRAGITHLLIHDQEALGPDFRQHAAEWQVTLVGESAPVRLYSIDTGRELRNN